MKKIVYKQADLQDEPLIADFYKKAFDELADYKYPDRFNWMYKDTPYQKDNGLLPIWLAMDEGAVVGMSSLMHQVFTVSGEEISGAWCCDLRILPQYRRMGIASRLEKLRMKNDDVYSVSSSDISIKIKEKLGYSSKYAYTSYLYIDRLDPDLLYNDLTRYLHLKRDAFFYTLGYKLKLHIIFSWFLSSLFKVIQKARKKDFEKVLKDPEIKKIEKFNEQASIFWNKIRNNNGLSAQRSCEYLNWKYVFQKNMSYQNYHLSVDNQMIGILVIRKAGNVGIISDVVVNNVEEWFYSILGFAVSELVRQGAEILMCCGSIEKHKKAIEDFGFIPLKNHHGVFHIDEKNRKLKDTIVNMPWFIGYGDHDIDEPGKEFHPSLYSLIKIFINI